MGGSASKQVSKDTVGLIDPGANNTKLIQTMDQLFQQLLTSTNPIHFKEALKGSSEGLCGGMLVILQPEIEKEFQRLAIQDPYAKNSSKAIIQSVFKGYETIEDFSSSALSKTLCREITLFFLRMIILVATCTLSVRPNRLMTGLLGTLGSQLVEPAKQMEEIGLLKYKGQVEIVLKEGQARKPDQPSSEFKDLFRPLSLAREDDNLRSIIKTVLKSEATSSNPDKVVKKDKDPLFLVVFQSNEYVFDLQNMVVYQNKVMENGRVGVMSLSTTILDAFKSDEQLRAEEKAREKARGGSRKHRSKRVRFTRKALKGGDPSVDIQYYLFNRTMVGCAKTDPKRSLCTSSPELRVSRTDAPIDFVSKVINHYTSVFNGSVDSKETVKKEGVEIEFKVKGSTDKVYTGLTLLEPKTYERLNLLLESSEAGKIQEGTSLAVYRAYTLASGYANNELQTYICHDRWGAANIKLTDLPFFALFEQLYNDHQGMQMEPETKDKYRSFINKLSAYGTVEKISDDPSLQNLRFRNLTKDTPLCKASLSGFNTIKDASVISGVFGEYAVITKEYTDLIESITKIMDKVFDYKLFLKEDRIKLRPIFVTDPRGAQKVLTEIIEEARTTLENHILAVEDSYMKGVALLTGGTIETLLKASPPTGDKIDLKSLVV